MSQRAALIAAAPATALLVFAGQAAAQTLGQTLAFPGAEGAGRVVEMVGPWPTHAQGN